MGGTPAPAGVAPLSTRLGGDCRVTVSWHLTSDAVSARGGDAIVRPGSDTDAPERGPRGTGRPECAPAPRRGEPRRSGSPDHVPITACLSGDQAAWEPLVRSHAGLVYTMIRRCGFDGAEAADLFHQTWLAACEQLGTVRDEPSVAGWLTILAARQARRALQRRTHPTGAGSERGQGAPPSAEPPAAAAPCDRSSPHRRSPDARAGRAPLVDDGPSGAVTSIHCATARASARPGFRRPRWRWQSRGGRRTGCAGPAGPRAW